MGRKYNDLVDKLAEMLGCVPDEYEILDVIEKTQKDVSDRLNLVRVKRGDGGIVLVAPDDVEDVERLAKVLTDHEQAEDLTPLDLAEAIVSMARLLGDVYTRASALGAGATILRHYQTSYTRQHSVFRFVFTRNRVLAVIDERTESKISAWEAVDRILAFKD